MTQAQGLFAAKSQIVWFFGPSAAGKATLIRKLADERPQSLLSQLRSVGLDIKVCEPSMQKRCGPPLVQVVPGLVQDDSLLVLLIKGQTQEDPCADQPRLLKQALPRLDHRIIFVCCELKEVVRRAQECRKGTAAPQSDDHCKAELETQLAKVGKLQSDLEIICVNATTHDYLVRPWPCEWCTPRSLGSAPQIVT